MSSFNQETALVPSQQRWKIGVDRRHVISYIVVALAVGFALGFVAARQSGQQAISPEAASSEKPSGDLLAVADATKSPDAHRVTRIVRADTIEVEGIGAVRMLGIETPDGKSPAEIYGIHGQNALAFVEKSLLGQEVRLELDSVSAAEGSKDETGCTLAYVYTRDGVLFNGEMIKQGHAFAQVNRAFLLIDQFRLLERDAMQAMRGVWGLTGATQAAQPAAASSQPPAASSVASQNDKPKRLSPLAPAEIGPNLPSTAASIASTEHDFFVSLEDKMYHKPGCDYLGKGKRAIALSQARAEGYGACSRCFASTVLRAK